MLASETVECEHCHGVHVSAVEKVKAHFPNEELLDDMSETFKVFGDKTRMKLLYVLHEQELCVCDIAEIMDMTQSAISHQLKVLKQAKLIKARRDGKQMYYALDDDHVHTMINMCMEHVCEKQE